MKNSEEIFDKEALIRSRLRSDKENNFLQKNFGFVLQDARSYSKRYAIS